MSVFAMVRGSVFRGLTSGRLWRVVTPVLAAVLLAGIGSQASAATPPVSFTGVGMTSPVLRQVGSTTWETTVLVTDTGSGCADTASVQYWLATRPDGIFKNQGVPGPSGRVAGTAPTGSACEVTVTFSNLAQVPTTAALVLDQSGASTSITLTVSRDVTLASYLGYPAMAGGIAVLLYLLSLIFVTAYDWEGLQHRLVGKHLADSAWWKHPIAGSGAWSAGDSWATNITTGLVVVSTFLAATTASSSLFPGVALDRFAIVNIVAGVFVVAAPVLFGILYALFTGHNPGPSADSVVKLPSIAKVILKVPSGATMTMVPGTQVIGDPPGPAGLAGTYQIPPGSVIAIEPPDPVPDPGAAPGAEPTPEVSTIAFSGTSDIGVLPGATVRIGPAVNDLPVSGIVANGAKITVTGTADINLPEHAVISGPRRRDSRAARPRWLLVPQGPTVIVGSLGIMIAVNIFTMFGIGAELGIAFVLAGFSDATGAWGSGIYTGLATLAGLVLWYAFSATRAMANPQPGSALSSQAGTSFTL